MNIIRLTILGNLPSMKNSRQIVTIGKRPAIIKSKAARSYEASALLQIPVAAKQMLTGPVRFTARIFYDSQRPDLDAGLLLDILAARYKRVQGRLVKIADGEYQAEKGERVMISKGVYVNDRQCREIHLYHAIDRVNPRAEVEIEPMEAQQIALLGEELLATTAEDDEDDNVDPF